MGLSLRGTTSGAIDINAPAVAGDNTITLPGNNGAANQFYKNSGTAGIVTHSSMVEDSSGNVGIGSLVPVEQLDVAGNVRIFEPSSTTAKTLRITNSSQNLFLGVEGTSGGENILGSSPGDGTLSVNGNLRLSADNGASAQFSLLNNGFVGIGSTVPQQALDVNSNFNVQWNGRVNIYRRTTTASNVLLDIRTDVGEINSPKFFVRTNGKTGIGTDAGGSTNNTLLTLQSITSSACRLVLANTGSSSGDSTQIYSQNDELVFNTNDGEAARFNSTGNLAFPSGQGIDFSATSDGSGMTSELLDDYEEGSGTPTVSFLTSGSLALGPGPTFKYVKIGDLVTFSFEFQITSVTTPSGSVKINLPFAAGAGVYSAGAVRLFNVTFTGSPFLEIGPSASYVLVNTNISGSPTGSVNSTGYYFGSISYRTTG